MVVKAYGTREGLGQPNALEKVHGVKAWINFSTSIVADERTEILDAQAIGIEDRVFFEIRLAWGGA